MQYNDIQTLWYETPGQNWTALRKTLESHRHNQYDGIEDRIVDRLYSAVTRLETSTEPYPSSANDLYNILYQNA